MARLEKSAHSYTPVRNLDREVVVTKPETTRQLTDKERAALEAKINARKQGGYVMEGPRPASVDLSKFETLKPTPRIVYGMVARVIKDGLSLSSKLGRHIKATGITVKINETGDTIALVPGGEAPYNIIRKRDCSGIYLHGKHSITGALTSHGIPLNTIYDVIWDEGAKAWVGRRQYEKR